MNECEPIKNQSEMAVADDRHLDTTSQAWKMTGSLSRYFSVQLPDDLDENERRHCDILVLFKLGDVGGSIVQSVSANYGEFP